MNCMVLNLVNLEQSDFNYKVSKFPDGQQTVDILNIERMIDIEMPIPVIIKTRLNSFQDLELIICATQALRNLRFTNIELYIPYFLGARSDRQFQKGGVNYLKQVICPIINSQNYSIVTVLDPHSDVLEACLNNYRKQNNSKLVKWALTEIDNKDGAPERTVFVSPDAGAYKKIFDVAQEFGVSKVITASKVRNLRTGEIIKTEIEAGGLRSSNIVIIDDICDGGRTFTEIAKVIKEQENEPTPNKLYLIVTHGIFSGGVEKLSDYFDGIFCTNSIKDVDPETIKVQSRQNDPEFVKQLNVF